MKKNMFDEDPSLNLDTNDLDIKDQPTQMFCKFSHAL